MNYVANARFRKVHRETGSRRVQYGSSPMTYARKRIDDNNSNNNNNNIMSCRFGMGSYLSLSLRTVRSHGLFVSRARVYLRRVFREHNTRAYTCRKQYAVHTHAGTWASSSHSLVRYVIHAFPGFYGRRPRLVVSLLNATLARDRKTNRDQRTRRTVFRFSLYRVRFLSEVEHPVYARRSS